MIFSDISLNYPQLAKKQNLLICAILGYSCIEILRNNNRTPQGPYASTQTDE